MPPESEPATGHPAGMIEDCYEVPREFAIDHPLAERALRLGFFLLAPDRDGRARPSEAALLRGLPRLGWFVAGQWPRSWVMLGGPPPGWPDRSWTGRAGKAGWFDHGRHELYLRADLPRDELIVTIGHELAHMHGSRERAAEAYGRLLLAAIHNLKNGARK